MLALNLPQFYETEENNKWWGTGFTEWTNVRNAKPLYKGHQQPMVPMDNNYYDLSHPETLQWQADLAKKYGIYGFIYFHYWYMGKRLLDKPCEVLLSHVEIDEKYCFFWANHSWTRAWDGKEHEVLVKQEYGNKSEWEEHIQYLLNFFRDPRYIKIDNKPILFIYKSRELQDAEMRIEYWDSRLIEEGFSGIYIVETINQFNKTSRIKNSNAVYEDEPSCSCRYDISLFKKIKRLACKKLHITDYQDYDYLWTKIINRKKTYNGKSIFIGAFPRWDNSPRKGKNSRIVRGSSPVKFRNYLLELANANRRDFAGVVVINAWNEWGEGAMLEPTIQDKYGYLEAIKEVMDELN